MKNNIAHLFLNASDASPDRPAIIERDHSISYLELHHQVAQTAAYFREKGLKEGDRVLVFIPMSIDLYRITLALFSIGAVAVFLDEWVSFKRLKLCCEIADCKAFIAAPKIRFLGWFVPVIRRIPIHLSATKRKRSIQLLSVQDVAKDSPALITFTTGSVGTPKAAVRSHGFLRIQFNALHPLLNNGNEMELIMLPIVLLLNLASGKTSVLPDFKFTKPLTFNPDKIWNQIEKHQIEGLVASPHYLIELAKFRQNAKGLNPLRTIVSGGSAIFPKDAELVQSTFKNTKFTIVFGSTEAEPISHCTAKELIENQSYQGVYVGAIDAVAQVQILRLDADLPHLCEPTQFDNNLCEKGKTGEILVSGEHVLKTYLKNEEIFKQNKIVVGETIWHKTGDAGYLTDENSLFLMGRVHQILTFDETQIYPFVAEKSIKEIEGVQLGTILKINDKAVLVYQSEQPIVEDLLRLGFPDLDFAKIVRLQQIPVDPRHRSKIDYSLLNKLISQ